MNMIMMKKFLVAFVLSVFSVLAYCEQMVEISAEIVEIYENKIKEIGLKFPTEILAEESSIPSVIESGSWARLTPLTTTLKALQTSGAAKVLSKPKLVTKSGTSARFMVGGEFPVVATGVGTSSVDWKEWGIIMKITPTVLKNKKIDILINTELSRLDYTVSVAGYPEISKRQASSNLQIKNGETMVLAGLIETRKNKIQEGIPFLSDIPILGILFSSSKTSEVKTNVVIFITTTILPD
jgi:pilus assembly protein CpaC